jgi:hypothetical protein
LQNWNFLFQNPPIQIGKKPCDNRRAFNPPMADKYQEQLSDAAKMPDFGTARKRNTV